MPFVAFMAKWLTTARGVRRTRPLSSISRCTTKLGNRCAPKKRVGSVTPAQDDGRETCHLGCCSIPACGYLNRATRRHTRFCGNKSRRASAERAVLIASSQRKERVESLSRQAHLKSWIEPFRGVMQKPPIWSATSIDDMKRSDFFAWASEGQPNPLCVCEQNTSGHGGDRALWFGCRRGRRWCEIQVRL